MDGGGRVWRLLRGTDQVGEITVDDLDFPWLHGTFVPGPAYDDGVRALLARELALSELMQEREVAADLQAWEAVYDELNRSLRLCAPDGRPVDEFLLHVRGDRAWFRWLDDDGPEPGGKTSV